MNKKTVYDASGNVVLVAPEDGYIGDFCDEGYAPFAGRVALKGGDMVEMSGYCRPSGEIVLAFCKPGMIVIPIKEDTLSRTIIDIPREKAKYEVKVVAYPQNGGVVDVPIWLEISKDKDVKSPYGDKTYGYLAVAYDPSKILHMRNQGSDDGEVFLNYFMAPMLVTGLYKDPYTRKNYLMLDGGEVVAGNIIVKENNAKTGKVDGFKTGLANLMLLFDGFNDIKITPAKYRVEILYGNIGDESFTFGPLERLSVEHGWLPGAHETFTQRKKGLFVRAKTAGLHSNFLKDRKMSFSDKKPQIWWYPTMEFYGGKTDKETVEKIVKNLGETYRDFVSDVDSFKDANFSDFVMDLENNVFKCNDPEK